MDACYDLSRNPPTFDVICFLSYIELERIRRGEEKIKLYIKPGPKGGFRQDSLWPKTIEQRIELRDKVLFPLCMLLPSVIPEIPWGNPPGEAYGLGERWISLPLYARVLAKGCRPLRSLHDVNEHWPKLVTITLREAEHHPLRNSQVAEWVRFAFDIEAQGYQVVIIRDTHARSYLAGVPTVDGPISPEMPSQNSVKAATDLFYRAQLYSRAMLNLGVNNGPMWMAIAMDAPVLMMRPTTDAAGGCYDTRFFRSCGIEKGQNLPGAPPHQRLCWEDDRRSNILEAFNSMVQECKLG